MSGQSLLRKLGAVLLAMVINACGDSQQAVVPEAAAAPQPAVESPVPVAQPATSSPVQQKPKARPGLDTSARTVELLNPDDSTMVFLYQNLAGLTPQFAQWVELDNRVRYGDPRDRAALRETIKAELEAAAASVEEAGLLRLSLQNANLSKYDPTYGEFVVGALSPGSVIEYEAFGQKVNLKFANGRTAQIWKVSPEQGQEIDDRMANSRIAKLDVLLQIRSVVPGPGGGSIMADVVEFELRDNRDDTIIGRVKVSQ